MLLQALVHRQHPEIYRLLSTSAPGLFPQPRPGFAGRITISSKLIRRPQNNGVGGSQFTETVETPESLAQDVEWRSLGDESIEVDIRTHFNGLRGYNENLPIIAAIPPDSY